MLLGKWVARQRYAWQNPDRSSARVTPERKALLDELGMVWEKTDSWQHRYELAAGLQDRARQSGRSGSVPDGGRHLAGQLALPPEADAAGGQKALRASAAQPCKELFKGENGRRLSGPAAARVQRAGAELAGQLPAAPGRYARKEGHPARARRICGRERLPAGRLDLEPPGCPQGPARTPFRSRRSISPCWTPSGCSGTPGRPSGHGAFRRAEEYCAAHGNLLVPVNYKTDDGFCLGDWIRRMRESYAAADDRLTAARVAEARGAGDGLDDAGRRAETLHF